MFSRDVLAGELYFFIQHTALHYSGQTRIKDLTGSLITFDTRALYLYFLSGMLSVKYIWPNAKQGAWFGQKWKVVNTRSSQSEETEGQRETLSILKCDTLVYPGLKEDIHFRAFL